MKPFTEVIAFFGALIPPPVAGDAATIQVASLLLILFLGLGTLIIVYQSIPGIVLFWTVMKGLLLRAGKKIMFLSE